MADTIKDGGPVYPCNITPSVDDVRAMREAGNLGLIQARNLAANHTGMSLRDAAALAALPAIIDVCKHDTREPGETVEQMFASKAWAVADAFIAAREGKTDG